MVKSNHNNANGNGRKKKGNGRKINSNGYYRFASMGRSAINIINNLYNPIDAINRFLNLALQHVDEESQSRQFLLDSKTGVKKMSSLLNRLNDYARKMEKEFNEISKANGQNSRTVNKR